MQLPPANILREQLLERLIIKEIQLQRAERIGLQLSDQAVNEAIGRIAQQNGVAFEDMRILLAEDGIPTTRHFKADETVSFRIVQTVAEVPSHFGRVVDIAPVGDGSVRVTGESGVVECAIDWSFVL